jgi:hypothetical protein
MSYSRQSHFNFWIEKLRSHTTKTIKPKKKEKNSIPVHTLGIITSTLQFNGIDPEYASVEQVQDAIRECRLFQYMNQASFVHDLIAKKEQLTQEQMLQLMAKNFFEIKQPLTPSTFECPICLGVVRIGESTRTECQHLFCKNCLETWLKGNTTCPICRTVIRE